MAKIYVLKAGARIPDGIIQIAVEEKIRTARVEAIGGVDRLTLAYLNQRLKKYEEHEFEGFMEVASLLGNLATKDGKPFLHAHGNFGRRDLSVVGGHVIAARVSPVLEVVITPTKNTALRKFDEGTGLNLIYETR